MAESKIPIKEIAIVLAVVAGVAIYFFLLYLFFRFVAPFLALVAIVLIVGVVLINYGRALGSTMLWGAGWQDSPTGPEPAYKSYFLRKAFFDYREVAYSSYSTNREMIVWVFKRSRVKFLNFYAWPLFVIAMVALVISVIAGACAYAILGAIHVLTICTCCAIVISFAGCLSLCEITNLAFRRIFVACPNCYEKISLAVYACPGCGKEHKQLMPGSYGVIWRRCQCNEALPTLFFFGRNRLPSFCPHCRGELPRHHGEIRNLHFAIVGGPSGGKTHFMMASLFELEKHGGIVVPEQASAASLAQARERFQRGVALDKTITARLPALQTKLTDDAGKKRLLYFYDAAGELFMESDRMAANHHYAYIHGIFLLVDPFSLQYVQTELAGLLQGEARIRPATDTPQGTYGRFIRALRSHSRSGDLRDVPLAVVLTKTDAFGLGGDLERQAMRLNLSNPELAFDDSRSRAVREWLNDKGESNLIRSLETDFSQLRYFSCSALGHMADGGVSFEPVGVLAPIAWMLQKYGGSFEYKVGLMRSVGGAQ